MRDPKRIDDIMRRLKKLWKVFPDLRLGQLLGNCLNYQQLYYLEDEDVMKAVEAFYSKYMNNNNK